MQTKLKTWLRTNFSLLLYITIGLITRFYNIFNRLYFVWDNGRDAWAIDKIVHGDFVLIGHTSGIQGFFLGPAWFYLGTIGHVLGKGNPWIIAFWYISVTAISLPLFYVLAHRLFKNKRWALVTAYLLMLVSGSINRSSFVWNPMITIPLMAATYLALLKARESRIFLVASFFLLALALQFEFAYAIFFVATIFLLIPWIRQKFDIKDFLYSSFAIGLTLVPQLLFEIRNKFIMTKSLLGSFQDKSQSVSFAELWKSRPEQLFNTTSNQLFDQMIFAKILMLLVIFVLGYGIYLIVKNKVNKTEIYKWKISYLLASIPFFFFMLWRGNHGNFFDYYLTPHFVLIIPALTLTLERIAKKEKWILFKKINLGLILSSLIILSIFWAGLRYFWITGVNVENNAGMKTMLQAVEKTYAWQKSDNVEQGIWRIFTPNRETEHYDYLIKYYAEKNKLPIPLTLNNESEKYIYVIAEPDFEFPEKVRYKPWHDEAVGDRKLIRSEKVGVLTLETWSK